MQRRGIGLGFFFYVSSFFLGFLFLLCILSVHLIFGVLIARLRFDDGINHLDFSPSTQYHDLSYSHTANRFILDTPVSDTLMLEILKLFVNLFMQSGWQMGKWPCLDPARR